MDEPAENWRWRGKEGEYIVRGDHSEFMGKGEWELMTRGVIYS